VFVCLSGFEEDVSNLIRETNDVTQLAIWCSLYKAELADKRSECHGLTDELLRAKRNLELTETKLADQATELSVANGRIASLEEDTASQVHK